MKERIVITDEKFVRQAHNTIVVGCPLEFEQVPETFEELKELCRDLEGKKIITTRPHIKVEDDCIKFQGLQFLKSGIICHEADIPAGFAIRLNRTPAQMWQIIKSLIGEE